ncbi:hypothetical protein QBC38DRAFT_475634 [Podospora fimiseda]|uniref:Uncharacterized protein n=1 Tax=Podospora fimiseda TaxID=252190 RepID=A0AAN7BRM1_9PEZI|nr:hypothetical protein QBC38DRAFT_475634 [Podospora fimiseda]
MADIHEDFRTKRRYISLTHHYLGLDHRGSRCLPSLLQRTSISLQNQDELAENCSFPIVGKVIRLQSVREKAGLLSYPPPFLPPRSLFLLSVAIAQSYLFPLPPSFTHAALRGGLPLAAVGSLSFSSLLSTYLASEHAGVSPGWSGELRPGNFPSSMYIRRLGLRLRFRVDERLRSQGGCMDRWTLLTSFRTFLGVSSRTVYRFPPSFSLSLPHRGRSIYWV